MAEQTTQIHTPQEAPPSPSLPQSLKKKNLHLGERIAETSIKIVASFSIVLIFLIFIFVFREASSLFFGSGEAPKTETAAPGSADSPESYGEPESGQPESYGEPIEENQESSDSIAGAGSEPESYNPELEDFPKEEVVAEENDYRNYVPNDNYPEIYNPETGSIPDIAMGKAPAPDPQTEKAQKDNREQSVWAKLWNDVWQPVSERPKFGLLPLLLGTLKATFVAILFAAPLGILAAIYTALFAKPRWREIIKPSIELLASFPSVVIGFFCMMALASLVQSAFGTEYRLNAFVGGIGLAIAVIPIIFTITEDALSAIPGTLREASLALGATEWETAFKVILPAATPGIFAAVLLGVGRAFGETMIALMATGNAALANFHIFQPARTFAATIGAEMGEVVWGSEHYGILFFLGVLLFLFSFIMNAVTEFYVKQRLIKKFQGS